MWAWDEKIGEAALKEVVATITNTVDATVQITIDTEVLETTAEHPFYTQEGWKDAADLTTQDQIKTKDHGWQAVDAIKFLYETKKVYNFEVADWHTYFVGVWAWLVHNAQVCYRKVFFDAYPLLKGKVVVHHSIEQHILKKWPGLFDSKFIHSLDNLRGIPKSINNKLHLSSIRKDWNKFYKKFDDAGIIPTKKQVEDYAKAIDNKYGKLFDPPIK